MTDKQINQYLSLVARRVKIILMSGIDWTPELGQELESIDAELELLRPLVDAAHVRKAVK